MREHLRIFNARETREVIGILNEHFGSNFSTDCILLENNKRRMFLLNRDYGKIDEKKLRINNMGLYFCTRERDGFRLSLEGSQLINPKKNFYLVTKEQAVKWISGESIKTDQTDLEGYVIVKYNGDIIGCGKFKQGEILNAVPKERIIVNVVIGS